ncbi:hypothetical protein Y032_0435g1409 [Ancylostoma ceylanicum]|uniref:Uncharacterized protein n=1 Tax=Ancylostoma ceylanicum TaxID=53326 RepID=A0A016X119_9BILA|nr:hypothetical protein Y032_0435g1409 [Ancylostoma ceylanicum]
MQSPILPHGQMMEFGVVHRRSYVYLEPAAYPAFEEDKVFEKVCYKWLGFPGSDEGENAETLAVIEIDTSFGLPLNIINFYQQPTRIRRVASLE